MNKLVSKEIFIVIRKAIKAKGKTYREIAKDISMSESGFKKLMSSEDCSLSRFNQICESLNLDIIEILGLAAKLDTKPITFSKKQEDAFLKEPSIYYFFSELHRFDYDESKLRKAHRLTKPSSLKYLRKLDRLDLIELGEGDRIKPINGKAAGIQLTARLGDKVIADLHKAFFIYTQEQFKRQTKNGHLGTGGRFSMKEETLKEMKKAYNDLINEFSKRSNREQVLFDKKELKEVNIMVFMAEGFDQSAHIHIEEI